MLQAGEIQAIVGDDSRDGTGGRQYCGLWSLTSRYRAFNAFGNSYAGLLPGDLRGKSPTLRVMDGRTAELGRRADDRHPCDCTAIYRVAEPFYIDHSLTITDRADLCVREGVPLPYREVSCCCYMNSPQDPRLHFRSRGEWFRYISARHGVGSNIAPAYVGDEELEVMQKQSGEIVPFHVDRIERRFDEPFYYGRLGAMVLILIFDTPRWLRFFCSPSGGGPSLLPDQACPAWDFEWIIPGSEYRLHEPYTFRLRLVYKRFESDDDVLAEVDKAQRDLGFERVSRGDHPKFP